MATLLELERNGELIRLRPNLKPREQELRTFMVTPEVRDWLNDILPKVPAGSAKELTPMEKLIDFLNRYGAGHRLLYPVAFRPIQHFKHGVWELKTPELRLFGWFPKNDVFICASIATLDDIKINGKPNKEAVNNQRKKVSFVRSKLPLDEPKYIPGREPEDVLSACDYRS